jgi:hypothetical protein
MCEEKEEKRYLKVAVGPASLFETLPGFKPG